MEYGLGEEVETHLQAGFEVESFFEVSEEVRFVSRFVLFLLSFVVCQFVFRMSTAPTLLCSVLSRSSLMIPRFCSILSFIFIPFGIFHFLFILLSFVPTFSICI